MFVRTLYAKPFSVETSNFARRSYLYIGWCHKEWFFCNLKIGRFARTKHLKIRFFMFVRTLYAKPFSVKTSHFARSSHLYVGWCRNEWFFCYLKIGRFAPKKHAKLFYFHNLCVLRPKKYAVKAVRCSSALCLFFQYFQLSFTEPNSTGNWVAERISVAFVYRIYY